jgi:hypothetical protein
MATQWDPDAPRDDECRGCGTRVSDRFRAVYGDDDDHAHACTECESWSRITRGAAAGREPSYEERPRPAPEEVRADGGGR